MVKSLYTDPIDWDRPELLRIQSTVVLLCEHVFDREDVNNTNKSNGYIEGFFLERYVSHFNKCRFFKNDMCEHVFDREDVSNTYKSNGYIEFYWRYMSPTSTNVDSLRNDMSIFCCLAAVTQSSHICDKIFTVVTKL